MKEFSRRYEEKYGSAYDWKKSEFIQADRLAKKHGYEECLRRLKNAFGYNYWFGELRTFGGIVKHFNELVERPKKKKGQFRRPSEAKDFKGGDIEL